MVAGIPLPYAAADAIYAAGLGLLLGVLFTSVRMILPKGALFAFICDLTVLVLGSVLYASIVVARFYAGVARWYTVIALILGYISWQIVAHSKFVYAARVVKFAVIFPFISLWRQVLKKPISEILVLVKQKSIKHKENKQKLKTKRIKQLQKPSQVLYNSK